MFTMSGYIDLPGGGDEADRIVTAHFVAKVAFPLREPFGGSSRVTLTARRRLLQTDGGGATLHDLHFFFLRPVLFFLHLKSRLADLIFFFLIISKSMSVDF